MKNNFVKKLIILVIGISFALVSILPSINAVQVENNYNENMKRKKRIVV